MVPSSVSWLRVWRDDISRWVLSLYRHPALFLVVFLVIPLALVCGWLYLVNEHQWRTREGESLLVSARLASRTIEEELLRVRQLEEAVATQPRFLDAVRRGDQARLRDSLQLVSALAPQVSRLRVTDLAGGIVSDLIAHPDERHAVSTRPPLDQPPHASAPSATTVSPVYLYDDISGEKAVAISTPLFEAGGAIGVLHAHVRLGQMARWLEKIRIEPAGFLYVVDARGFLVSYPFQLLPGQPKNVSSWAPVSVPVTERGGVVRFHQGHPRAPWTAGVVAMTPFGWRVVAQQPDAQMLKPLYQLGGPLAGLIALLALLISAAVLRWAHLHHVTLRLLDQQSRLLKSAQQERFRAQCHHASGSAPEPGHAA